MKRTTTFVFLLVLTISIFLLSSCSTPPEDVANAAIGNEVTGSDTQQRGDSFDETQTSYPLDPEKSNFTFTGYGPGKEHDGTFLSFSGTLTMENGVIVGASGSAQTDSVSTGIGPLDNHLKGDDFFDAENYPAITFVSTAIVDGTFTGLLDFHGITREISFPVTVLEDGISADFLLDITPFNLKYAAIDDNVRIRFTVRI
ncbi:MAG: YceI family protein [Candidatus Woesearchaeota archaeon]|nr:MAG: YceI family protein [Candidatus Woesearchaeota archaeon]